MPVIKDKGHSKYPILLGSYSLTFLYSYHICQDVAKAQWSNLAFASYFTFSFTVPTPNRTQLCMSMFLQRKVGKFFFVLKETWIFILNGSWVFPISLGGAPTGGLLNQRSGGDFGHDYQEEGWFHLSWVSIKSSSFATQSSSPLHRHAFPLGEEMKAETHRRNVVDVSRILDPDNEFGCGLSSAR